MIRPLVYHIAFLNGFTTWKHEKIKQKSFDKTVLDDISEPRPLYYSRLAHSFSESQHGTTVSCIPDGANTSHRCSGGTNKYISQRNVRCNSVATPDSVFREPLPGEEITLPNPSAPTGEYLLDRGLIAKVAELRTFLEDIEVSRGKKSKLKLMEREMNKEGAEILQLTEEEADKMEDVKDPVDADYDMGNLPPIEINDKTLEPIADHVYEENMLEEVLGKAISVYRKDRDQTSVQRLQEIAEEMAPFVEKIRKERAEAIIVRLIRCFVDKKEDLDTVLEQLHRKKQLNKYLMRRFDELINLSAQKYRISDKHPAQSESFLRTLKDRVAAQIITSARGTQKYNTCVEYERVLTEHLRKIEDIEDFRSWLLDGIAYCREKGRMEHRLEAMETIESIVVSLHPVWTPVDDHIETEATAYDHPIIYDDTPPDE
ncbi:hypothetical protein BaOVIS_008300 [Babesia ovis]|uniref:Uncharacterized protein n=1 Tax=Babesia ovis TaxID=5869 RepID=A0A9W5WU15_BABOV|nr:hypothetical protein BaOVIS_008300 [Babesia ovis]